MDVDREDVLARARRGQRSALGELLVANLPNLEAYVRLQAGAVVRGRESISDLVQSACLQALGALDRFEFRGEPQFRRWLCQHALHKIINKREHYGAQMRDVRREVAQPTGADDRAMLSCYASILTPSRAAAGREALERFERAFAGLPPDQREAITLQRIIGLDYAEIAADMQRSENAVRNLVYRGLSRLAVLLEGGGSTPGDGAR